MQNSGCFHKFSLHLCIKQVTGKIQLLSTVLLNILSSCVNSAFQVGLKWMFDNSLIISRSSIILFFRTFHISDSLIQSIIDTVRRPNFIYQVFKFPKVLKVQMDILLSSNRKELVLSHTRHTNQFASKSLSKYPRSAL